MPPFWFGKDSHRNSCYQQRSTLGVCNLFPCFCQEGKMRKWKHVVNYLSSPRKRSVTPGKGRDRINEQGLGGPTKLKREDRVSRLSQVPKMKADGGSGRQAMATACPSPAIILHGYKVYPANLPDLRNSVPDTSLKSTSEPYSAATPQALVIPWTVTSLKSLRTLTSSNNSQPSPTPLRLSLNLFFFFAKTSTWDTCSTLGFISFST